MRSQHPRGDQNYGDDGRQYTASHDGDYLLEAAVTHGLGHSNLPLREVVGITVLSYQLITGQVKPERHSPSHYVQHTRAYARAYVAAYACHHFLAPGGLILMSSLIAWATSADPRAR